MGKFKSMFLCCKPCGQRGDVYEVSRAAASTPPIVSLSVKRMNNSSLRIHSRPSVECEDQIIIDKNASSPSLNSFESDDKRTESLRVSLASCPDSSGFDAQDIPSYPLAEEAAIEPDSIAQAIPTCPVPEDVTVEPKWVARDIPSYPLADEAAVEPSIAQDIPTCPLLEDVAVGPDSVAQDVPSCPLAVEVVVERDLDVPVADVTEFSDYVSTLEVIDDEENQKSTQAIKIMHNCSVMYSPPTRSNH